MKGETVMGGGREGGREGWRGGSKAAGIYLVRRLSEQI